MLQIISLQDKHSGEESRAVGVFWTLVGLVRNTRLNTSDAEAESRFTTQSGRCQNKATSHTKSSIKLHQWKYVTRTSQDTLAEPSHSQNLHRLLLRHQILTLERSRCGKLKQ